MLWKIDGYLAIPHELLHILAYRLLGKPYRYQLGDHYVYGTESCSIKQRVFILLFPLLIIASTALGLLGIWMVTYISNQYPIHPFNYFLVAPVWHKFIFLSAIGLMLYAGSCIGDIQMTVRLLFQKLSQNPPQHTNKGHNGGHSPQETDNG